MFLGDQNYLSTDEIDLYRDARIANTDVAMMHADWFGNMDPRVHQFAYRDGARQLRNWWAGRDPPRCVIIPVNIPGHWVTVVVIMKDADGHRIDPQPLQYVDGWGDWNQVTHRIKSHASFQAQPVALGAPVQFLTGVLAEFGKMTAFDRDNVRRDMVDDGSDQSVSPGGLAYFKKHGYPEQSRGSGRERRLGAEPPFAFSVPNTQADLYNADQNRLHAGLEVVLVHQEEAECGCVVNEVAEQVARSCHDRTTLVNTVPPAGVHAASLRLLQVCRLCGIE